MKTKIKLELDLVYDGKLSKEEINKVLMLCHSRVISQLGWGSLSLPDHDIQLFPEMRVKEHGYKV